MDVILRAFAAAQQQGDGYELARTLMPISPPNHPDLLRAFHRSTNVVNVKSDIIYGIMHEKRVPPLKIPKAEGDTWADIYVSYWLVVGEILKAEDATRSGLQASWTRVYESWKDLTNILIRGYSGSGFQAWTVPCLYITGKYLRVFAIKADNDTGSSNGEFQGDMSDDFNPDGGKNEKLEDAARMLNRIFTLCLSDRAPLEDSRKWGIYNIVNLLFKTYFKLNSITLSKNILRALQVTTGDMPDLEAFPKSHQVTFKYYLGVIQFLEEDYVKAEENLTQAWTLCHKNAKRNKELILTYLIPCHLLTTHTLPTQTLLKPYPQLQNLFSPLSNCIRRGDLAGFDAALAAGEDEFVKRRIYLTLERGRDVALRNLLRKVFVASVVHDPKDGAVASLRRTRIPVAEFGAAISIGSKERLENDEVECLLANMIYKNLMKGYISREHGIVVLSKGGAFPGTGV